MTRHTGDTVPFILRASGILAATSRLILGPPPPRTAPLEHGASGPFTDDAVGDRLLSGDAFS